MTPAEAVELARAYVALSNAHRCDLIRPLFAAGARYRSSAVGEFHGVDAIIEMMRGFFSRYPDVRWRCDAYRCSGRQVSFDFELTALVTGDGNPLRRAGVEYIDFDDDGLINSLEVHSA